MGPITRYNAHNRETSILTQDISCKYCDVKARFTPEKCNVIADELRQGNCNCVFGTNSQFVCNCHMLLKYIVINQSRLPLENKIFLFAKCNRMYNRLQRRPHIGDGCNQPRLAIDRSRVGFWLKTRYDAKRHCYAPLCRSSGPGYNLVKTQSWIRQLRPRIKKKQPW